jgi:hypothetical protein
MQIYFKKQVKNIVEIWQNQTKKEVATGERNGMAKGFCEAVCSGEVDPLFTYFTDDARFYIKGHVNTQNKRYWSAGNPRLIYKVPLYDITVGVRCAISVT